MFHKYPRYGKGDARCTYRGPGRMPVRLKRLVCRERDEGPRSTSGRARGAIGRQSQKFLAAQSCSVLPGVRLARFGQAAPAW